MTTLGLVTVCIICFLCGYMFRLFGEKGRQLRHDCFTTYAGDPRQVSPTVSGDC